MDKRTSLMQLSRKTTEDDSKIYIYIYQVYIVNNQFPFLSDLHTSKLKQAPSYTVFVSNYRIIRQSSSPTSLEYYHIGITFLRGAKLLTLES